MYTDDDDNDESFRGGIAKATTPVEQCESEEEKRGDATAMIITDKDDLLIIIIMAVMHSTFTANARNGDEDDRSIIPYRRYCRQSDFSAQIKREREKWLGGAERQSMLSVATLSLSREVDH